MNYVSQENIDNIVKGLSNKIAMSVSNGALIGDTTPVGTVISFMGTQAPLFYLVCDGTTYNIAEYQELADFIEAQFGAVNYFGGDGVDTFAVPDLRGEFLRGTGTNSHENQGSGANVGVHKDATEHWMLWASKTDKGVAGFSIPANITSSTDYYGSNSIGSKVDSTIFGRLGYVSSTSANDNFAIAIQQSTSTVSGAITSRPTNTSVLYCIKYTKAVIPSEYEDGTPVGRVIFDSILREGYIKANGAQIEDASISIPRLLSFVQKYSSQLIASDQATYEANVGLYMYDSNNDILTLPNYIGRFMEGGNSVTSIEAGLPNIKGSFGHAAPRGFNDASVSPSVLFTVGSGSPMQSLGGSTIVVTEINAHNYSPIYSDSVNTVQPSSITLIPQIRY